MTSDRDMTLYSIAFQVYLNCHQVLKRGKVFTLRACLLLTQQTYHQPHVKYRTQFSMTNTTTATQIKALDKPDHLPSTQLFAHNKGTIGLLLNPL